MRTATAPARRATIASQTASSQQCESATTSSRCSRPRAVAGVGALTRVCSNAIGTSAARHRMLVATIANPIHASIGGWIARARMRAQRARAVRPTRRSRPPFASDLLPAFECRGSRTALLASARFSCAAVVSHCFSRRYARSRPGRLSAERSWLTDPSSSPANPPCPREPTTSRSALRDWSTSTLAAVPSTTTPSKTTPFPSETTSSRVALRKTSALWRSAPRSAPQRGKPRSR